MDISIEEFENLKKRIETLEKLVNSHGKEIEYIWTNTSGADNWPSLDNLTILEKDQTKIEPKKFEICILNQTTYCDRGGSWTEEEFQPIGITTFMTENEALNYLNGDVKKMDTTHYMYICEGRKLYLHNRERNVYKRLRKTPEDKYYLKKLEQ